MTIFRQIILKHSINSAIITDLVFSDHFAVLQFTRLPISFATYPSKQTRDLNSVTLESFRDQLNAIDWSDIWAEIDPDLALSKFQNALNSIFSRNHPTQKRDIKI